MTECIRKAEESYYQNLINSERHNSHTLWSIFGSIVNLQKMKKCSKIKELFYNNKLVSKDQDKANTLNEHFSTIGSRMANNIKPSKSYKDFLNNPNIDNFYLYPTDKVET